MAFDGQRHTKRFPCPACGGWKELAAGQGTRCFGWTSTDGEWIHCTRPESAGPLPMLDGNVYLHKGSGPCNCGVEHQRAPVKSRKRSPSKVTHYRLATVDDTTVAEHVRLDFGPKEKEFYYQRDGKRNLNGLSPQDLPLYGTELLAKHPGRAIVVHEGEKAAEASRTCGVTLALGTLGSSTNPSQIALHPLKGRRVFLWPDNDDVGRVHMAKIAETLRGMGTPPAEIRLIDWPNAPAGGDAADYVQSLHPSRSSYASFLHSADPYPFPGATTVAYPQTDEGNGMRFADQYRTVARWCAEMETWYCFDGRRWKPDNEQALQWAREVRANLTTEAEQMTHPLTKDSAKKWAKMCGTPTRLRLLLEEAQLLLRILPSEFDQKPYLFNCLNGTIDLMTGRLQAHQSADFLTMIAPVMFDPTASSADLQDFLQAATNGDRGLLDYLQAIAAYCLTGNVEEETLFFVYSPKTQTGKSTFLDALRKAWGDYAKVAMIDSFLQQNGNGNGRHSAEASPDIARLVKARMVVTTEMPKNRMLNEPLVKALSGGDQIATRTLYKGLFELQPEFKLIFMGNSAPTVSDDDPAMQRRMRRIPFDHEFLTPDPAIKRRLCDPTIGGPAILAWAVQGLPKWRLKGLVEPEVVIRSTIAYREEVDVVANWLEECAILTPSASTSLVSLHSSFTEWWRRSGNRERPLTQRLFAERLVRRGFLPSELGQRKLVMFNGVQLTSAIDLFTPAVAGRTASILSLPQKENFAVDN